MTGARVARPITGILVAALLCAAPAARAAPAAELWPRWQAHDPASTAVIGHRAWDRFLKTYVRPGPAGVNRLPYGAVRPGDRTALSAYVRRLSGIRIGGHNRREQFAYWVNLYNAMTVKLVIDRWPVKSIRDINISPGLFARGPWRRKLATVEGVAVSLDDIEHRILRPIWRDPRIHYVVNCASVGCPNLRRTAFTGANAETLLERAARAYVNHRRGVRIERGRVVASRIYDWYRADFGGSLAGVLAHLRRYARPALKARLQGVRRIDGFEYDWTINEAR